MLRTITILLIGLIISSGLIAQNQQKAWKEGKLKWEDFNGDVKEQGSFEFKYTIGYSTGKQKYGDTSVVRNTVTCYMVKNLSWINPDNKTDKNLRYNQVVFDIVEIYTRKIQKEFDNISSTSGYDQVFNPLYVACYNEINEFSIESKDGQDTNALLMWEYKTSQEIKDYRFQKIPNYDIGDFGYGLWGGIGTGFSTGSLGDHFSPIYSIVYGFDFSYGQSMLFLNATIAGSKIKQDYASDIRWTKGSKVGVSLLDLSYGYTFIDDDKYKITPFVGFGVIQHSLNNPDIKTESLNMTDYRMSVGINLDYKLITRVNLIPAFIGIKEKSETSIRARLYITRARYYDDMKGVSINLGIGISGFGNAIRIN